MPKVERDRALVEVRWTTERKGNAKRHSKTIEAWQLPAFLKRLEERDAFQIDSSRWS